ncbi:MAG: Holliday junction branch migration protein RuvA [Bacteroidales bacterium]
MIEYVSGKLAEATPTYAVIDCNGLGYLLHITLNTYAAIQNKKEIKLFVHEVIREDAHLLYGFLDKQEREMFLLLTSVSGVGASIGRMILSSMSVSEIGGAIAGGNSAALKKVKGVGQKTAERICVDLKDKIKTTDSTLLVEVATNSQVQTEAVTALVMLGFVKAQSEKVVTKILSGNPSATVEELIKAALKLL